MSAEKKISLEATCPDCGGPLSVIDSGTIVEFECLVGHRYTPSSVLKAHSASEEKALWGAIVAVEETKTLVDKTGRFFSPELVKRLKQQVQQRKEIGAEIRKLIERLEPLVLE